MSIPHVETLSICHIYKNLLYICVIEILSICGIDKTVMSILGIEKLSIFYI